MGIAGNISPQRLQEILRAGPPDSTPPATATSLWDLALLEHPRGFRSAASTIKHPIIVNPELSGGYAVGRTARSHIGLRVSGTKPELWFYNIHNGLSVTVLVEDRAISISVLPENKQKVTERLKRAFEDDSLLATLEKTYSKLNTLKSKGVPPSEIETLLGAELSLYEPQFYKATSA